MTLYQPTDAKQLAELVEKCAAIKDRLELFAGGSKRAFGRPVLGDHEVDVSSLCGIIAYEAPELVLTARPATPLATINAALREKGQMLAFEPPLWRDLMQTQAQPTLGGVLACNLSGPRRVRAGAARDFILGFSAVNGRGELFKAGGKVVKNVTGFDLSKLLVGSFGTLAILTEVTLKVMPRPETECTLLLRGLDDASAFDAMSRALNTPFEVSGVAHLPPPSARRAKTFDDAAATAIRVEGPSPSVAWRAAQIEKIFAAAARLDAEASARLWSEIGEVRALLPQGEPLVWRLCTTPSRAPALVGAIARALTSAEAFYDWGGGQVWLSLDAMQAGPDGGDDVVRGLMQAAGGHATLIVAPASVRAAVNVFEAEPPALSALSARVKRNFDPMGVFNPGRVREGA
jgi:glycolate oxidase FAD binding subunit